MKKIILLVTCLLLIGCAITPRTNLTDHPAYRNASQDNRERIKNHRVGVGMTIEECQISWDQGIFRKVRADSLGYELWRVKNGDRDVYLHVRGGVVTSWSEYIP